MSQVYQRGSIRRVPRKKGEDVWEWRYRVNGVMRQEKFSVGQFPTEKALWRHLETHIKTLNSGQDRPVGLAVTMGVLIRRYREECLPELAKSTRDTDGSMLTRHIEPQWADVAVADIKAMAVDAWLKTLDLSPASKGRARRLLKQLYDKAVYWELIPDDRTNPMTLVKIKGVTKRQKKVVILSPDQVTQLINSLDEPYNLMVYVAASLGLRVEETIALQWGDFDWGGKTVTISRAYTHGHLGETKSAASAATLPLPDGLITALRAYEPSVGSKWLWPSPKTGECRSADMILADRIKPAAKRLGLPPLGWHTLRHSYRSWIASGAATLSQQKDMMRHSDIATTANIYGGTPVEEMRPLIDAVGARLGSASL